MLFSYSFQRFILSSCCEIIWIFLSYKFWVFAMPRQLLKRKCMVYYHQDSWLCLNLLYQKISHRFKCQIIMDLVWNLAECHEKCHSHYCKTHSPLFFVSFFQGKMLKSIKNLYLGHMHLVLQLIIDDWYNQKPWRNY